MGLLLSKLADTLVYAYSFANKTRPCNISLFGLDNAGKTTILFKVKLYENISAVPTIGFNVETVELCKGLSLTIWDVGGGYLIRNLWYHYIHFSQGLIFVVDSNDPERLKEAADWLQMMMKADRLIDFPIVVMANKQDLPSTYSFK